MAAPNFQVVSDRRGESLTRVLIPTQADHCEPGKQTGGRTAWSATVAVQGQSVSARYWYDGTNMENAKEDAAQVAYYAITGMAATTSQPGYY